MAIGKDQRDPAAKALAVLQGLTGKSVTEICKEHRISAAEYQRWRMQVLSRIDKPSEAGPNSPGGSADLASLLAVLGHGPEAVPESLRIAQQLIEVLPIPIFFKGRDGKYLGVNRAWEDFFGVPRATFLGKEVHDLYPKSPEVAQKHYEMDQELWEQPGSQSYEIPVTTRHGQVRHTIYHKATFTRADGAVAGLIGTIVDITERKQEEQRQAIEYQVTRALAEAPTIEEAMPRVIQSLCESLGYAYGARWLHNARENVLRSTESWCVDDPAVEEFRRMSTSRIETPGVPGGLNRRVWATGEPVWLSDVAQETTLQRREPALHAGLRSAFAFPILVGGEFYGVMEFFGPEVRQRNERVFELARTIGIQVGQFIARRQAEAALREAHDQLTRKAQELARSNAELEQFAYVASHDLQEPLRMVSSYTQLLNRRYGERLEADAKEFMEFIVDGATRMKQLIEDILAYSRVGTHGKELRSTEGERVLSKALTNLRAAIEGSDATVTHDPLPRVEADEAQLVQLFQNLIGNALKFKAADAPRIHVGVTEKPDTWVFGVGDNGIGIHAQYFERIFMLFQRLHGKSEYGGTGIGLAICKKVVDRHGGRIWVESRPGHGSTFFFTLPRKGGQAHG